MRTLYWAICKSRDGTLFTTNTLYETLEEASTDLGECFVMLALDYPFQIFMKETHPKEKEIDPNLKRYLPKVKRTR